MPTSNSYYESSTILDGVAREVPGQVMNELDVEESTNVSSALSEIDSEVPPRAESDTKVKPYHGRSASSLRLMQEIYRIRLLAHQIEEDSEEVAELFEEYFQDEGGFHGPVTSSRIAGKLSLEFLASDLYIPYSIHRGMCPRRGNLSYVQDQRAQDLDWSLRRSNLAVISKLVFKRAVLSDSQDASESELSLPSDSASKRVSVLSVSSEDTLVEYPDDGFQCLETSCQKSIPYSLDGRSNAPHAPICVHSQLRKEETATWKYLARATGVDIANEGLDGDGNVIINHFDFYVSDDYKTGPAPDSDTQRELEYIPPRPQSPKAFLYGTSVKLYDDSENDIPHSSYMRSIFTGEDLGDEYQSWEPYTD
ncbi:hypothetical protein C8Q75DRAFT_789106 [Abortiporus biennis]|nr:hypothetical protein C8Q75DRAFT_789106 [Abortiporus biennis]